MSSTTKSANKALKTQQRRAFVGLYVLSLVVIGSAHGLIRLLVSWLQG